MPVILFVDNVEASHSEYRPLLEKYGYTVVSVKSIEDAKKKLGEPKFDLAIIDIRLENDEDEKDISGLILAREEAHFLPKIILTGHPSQEADKLVLRVFPDGIPPAISIIRKGSKYYPELLEAIRSALALAKVWQGMASYNAALQRDYDTAQKQAQAMYTAALVLSVLGAVIIFAGIVATIWTASTGSAGRDWMLAASSLLGTLAGIVTEVIGLLFFRRVDVANQRMDRYHNEHVAGLRFEVLFSASGNLLDAAQTVEIKKAIILRAAQSWLGEAQTATSPAEKDKKP
jgi:CheY-like chemotaxis protein